jgi:hypothetical protein
MVSHEENASWLVSVATGWLDWDFDKAMRADCCAILLAYDGKLSMLKAIYGTGEEEPDTNVSERPLTPELFSALWG